MNFYRIPAKCPQRRPHTHTYHYIIYSTHDTRDQMHDIYKYTLHALGRARPPPQLSCIYNYCGPSNLTPRLARSTNTECDRNFMIISFINIRGGLPYFMAVAVLFINFPTLNDRNHQRTYYYDIFIILLQY